MSSIRIIDLLQEQLKIANASNRELLATISSLNETIKKQSNSITSLEKTIASLEDTLLEKDKALNKTSNKLRGVSKLVENKSEKQKKSCKSSGIVDIASTSSDMPKQEDDIVLPKATFDPKTRKNNNAKRNMHNYELEEVIKHLHPDNDDFDANIAKELSTKVSIRYKMIPMRFQKIKYILHSYKQGDKIFSPKVSQTPLLNSSYDGSFIAGIAQLRYIYSMPVERIVKYFQENGFELNKATANGLLAKVADLLENMHKALKLAVLEDVYLGCDETYHKVMVRMENKNIMKGYIWGLLGMSCNLVYYFYDNGSRAKRVITHTLESYTDVIQCDGYAPYKKINSELIRLSCFQHCKRKFIDIKNNPQAEDIVNLINLLYQREHEHKIGVDGWSVKDNLEWRREYSPKIMSQIKSKLIYISESPDYPPKSQLNLAANYMLNEWDALERIFNGGAYRLDNNSIERLNRYISLSRRNSLFFGSHEGAKRGVIYYSLACSCRLNGINFFDYISDITNRAASIPPNSPIEYYREMLPDRWKNNNNL